jgi:hypothetical protein
MDQENANDNQIFKLKPATSGFELCPFKAVVKVQSLYIKQFEIEDSDCPEGNIGGVNRWLDYWCGIIDPANYSTLTQIIGNGSFGQDDSTFKPICDNLRKLGYVIILDPEEQKRLISERSRLLKTINKQIKTMTISKKTANKQIYEVLKDLNQTIEKNKFAIQLNIDRNSEKTNIGKHLLETPMKIKD